MRVTDAFMRGKMSLKMVKQTIVLRINPLHTLCFLKALRIPQFITGRLSDKTDLESFTNQSK